MIEKYKYFFIFGISGSSSGCFHLQWSLHAVADKQFDDILGLLDFHTSFSESPCTALQFRE